MTENQSGSLAAFIAQVLALLVGIGLVYSAKFWTKPLPVLMSGIFFINLFWITMVLTHDIAIWSWLRNSLIGNIAMFGLVLVNLLAIVYLVIVS